MAFDRSFNEAIAICEEQASARDVAADVQKTPLLLGGITPADADWTAARTLYVDMLKSGCSHDKEAAANAYERALEGALSQPELDALVAFYRSPLGVRYVAASLTANTASYRAAVPTGESTGAYERFEKGLAALLAARQPAAPPKASAMVAVRAFKSPDEAVALSDRVMRMMAEGDVAEAIELATPFTVVSAEQWETLIKQATEQQPVLSERFGKTLDYELLRNDMVSDSLIRAVFLQRFERYAMVWQFIWYRGQDGWVLTHLRYGDDIGTMFR